MPEDGIERIATELGGAELASFFTRYVRGTDEPPLDDLLGAFGIAVSRRAAESESDRGGKAPAGTTEGDPSRAWLGATLTGGASPVLQHVFSGGPAEQAGLAGGDAIVAVDGLRASVEAIDRMLRRRRAGEVLTVHAFRRDELVTTAVTLAEDPRNVFWLAPAKDADADTRARRADWLGRDC